MRQILSLLSLTALVIAVVSSATAANLAPEAAYSVTLYGFAWRGQLVPGTNSTRPTDGYMAAPPWQGPATTLSDGRRDDPAVVSWYWSNMDKRIEVVFDLRRTASVTAVRAWTKAGAGHSFSRATMRLAATAAALEQGEDLPLVPAGEGAAWEGQAVSGRFLRLVCDTPTPTLSLSEVEIEGEATGPVAADAPPPGLIAVAPRDLAPLVQLPPKAAGASNIAPGPEVKLRVSSRHYDDKSSGFVDDQCAAQSDPGGNALRDGNMKTAVASFSDWYSHKTITAEFDLGRDYQLDRLVVWSAGHDGPARSYLNAFRLWVQPAQGAPWVPVGETRNPVLPAEKPAAAYPIISAPLDRPARMVRLQFQGVAQSADVMQIAEIEIWAKPVTGVAAAKPLRIKQPVPPITPVALGKLSPAYDWITAKRLRGLYTYIGRSGESEVLKRAVEVGYNTLLVHTMGKAHSEQGWPEEAAKWVEVQKRYPLRVIISWPFGSDERYGNTQFGAYQPGGETVWKKTPCPLSAEYWNRVVGDRAELTAKLGLTGMVIDMEMYGGDSTRYPGPCCCEDCWRRFVEAHLEGVSPADVLMADRPAWLEANDLLADYKRWQELEVMAILRGIEQRVHAVNPNFLLGNLLDFEPLPGLARGFGTPTLPALICSEIEYWGNLGGMDRKLARMREQGYPALYVPGLWPQPVLPEQLEKLIPQAAMPSAGFWVWSCLAYDDKAAGDYGHAKGHTAEEYWLATKAGNQALDTALGGK